MENDPAPEGSCQELREWLPELPRCCALCHGREDLRLVLMGGRPLRLCCHLVSGVLTRVPGSLIIFTPEAPSEV